MPKDKHKQENKSGEDTRYVPYAKGFKPSTMRVQAKAIGCEPVLPEFDPSPFNGFEFFPQIPQPTSIDDWLAQYNEEGQTFKQFLKECPWFSSRKRKYMNQTFQPNGKTIRQKYPEGKIYVLPLGNFSGEHCVRFDDLIEYAEIFLGIPVVSLPGIKLEIKNGKVVWIDEADESRISYGSRNSKRTRKYELNTRYDERTKHHQIRVDETLLKLRAKIPADALCMIGLTMSDLYGDETDLFVAGMAAGNHRVAVFSFCRYDPTLAFSIENWYDIREDKHFESNERKRIVLQRSCKLLVHEINHLLGLDHCIFFDCCMNGSGHLSEDFRQPMHLCPVDLHKLQTLVGFDVVDRYRKLKEFYKKHGMDQEATWVDRRIDFIQRPK